VFYRTVDGTVLYSTGNTFIAIKTQGLNVKLDQIVFESSGRSLYYTIARHGRTGKAAILKIELTSESALPTLAWIRFKSSPNKNYPSLLLTPDESKLLVFSTQNDA